jgi:hypothetical protein
MVAPSDTSRGPQARISANLPFIAPPERCDRTEVGTYHSAMLRLPDELAKVPFTLVPPDRTGLCAIRLGSTFT